MIVCRLRCDTHAHSLVERLASKEGEGVRGRMRDEESAMKTSRETESE